MRRAGGRKGRGRQGWLWGTVEQRRALGQAWEKGVSVGTPSTEIYRITFSLHKHPAHQTTDTDLENKTHTQNQSVSYLPIMVECCWTAASSSLSKMVHSPMVTGRWRSCQRKQDLGSQPLFLRRILLSLQDQPAFLGIPCTPVPHQSPFDLYTLTWPLVSASLTVCVCELVSSPGPVPLCYSSWWRRGADWLPPPSSLPQSLPLPCAVMLVLPLPHHSALHYSICYSSQYDSHLFSTWLSSSSSSFSPFPLLSLPSSSTLPPGHSLYFRCTPCHQYCSPLVLALCRISAFAAALLL